MYENDSPYADIVAGRYEGITPDDIPPITTAMPIRPDGPYGIVKALGEAAERYFADEFGLSAICLRIGTLNRESRSQAPRQFATLLTHDDLVQLVDKSIRAPDDLRFGIYYGVSNNRWRFCPTLVSDSDASEGHQPGRKGPGLQAGRRRRKLALVRRVHGPPDLVATFVCGPLHGMAASVGHV